MIYLTVEAVLALYLLSCFACLLIGYFSGQHRGYLNCEKLETGWMGEALWWRIQHEKAVELELLSD